MIDRVKRLRERRQLRSDLEFILDTPQGQRFFKVFLRHCNVTRPVFHRDPVESASAEGCRRLAMSYLSLLGQDDPQSIINRLEEMNEDRKQDIV